MNPLGIVFWLWGLLPWYVQLGVVGFVAFTSIGGTVSLYQWLRAKIGKWAIPAMFSLVIPVGLWLFSFFGKKAVPTEAQYPHPDRPEDRPIPKKRRKGETAADRWEK